MKELKYEIVSNSDDIRKLKIKFDVIVELSKIVYNVNNDTKNSEFIDVEEVYTKDEEIAIYLFGVDYKYKEVYVLTDVISESIEDFLDNSKYYDNYETNLPKINDEIILEYNKKYLVTLTSEFIEDDFYENSEDCLIQVVKIDII